VLSLYQFLQLPFRVITGISTLAGLFLIGISYFFFQFARRSDTQYWVGVIFLAALGIRLCIILFSPFTNLFVDIGMYQDMGQLVINGANPYDFNNETALRAILRTDERAYVASTSATQTHWNYNTSSQLPFFELFMGWIELLYPHLYTYRLIFAWIDSLTCLCVLLIVTQNWVKPISYFFGKKIGLTNLSINHFLIITAVAISVVSPIFLRSGTLIPNIKGNLTFLILAAVFLSYQRLNRERIWLSAIFLGLSVSFMALGIFVVPLILRNLYSKSVNHRAFFIDASLYITIALFSCFFWFIPFYEGLLHMIQYRLKAGTTVPLHGSIWRFVAASTPAFWQTIKTGAIILFVLVHLVGIWRKKLSLEIITASLFLLFVQLLTTDGSMDRLNISLMVCVCLYGFTQQCAHSVLVPLYVLGGALSVSVSLAVGAFEKIAGYQPFEYSLTDSVFNALFLIVYLFLIARISWKGDIVSWTTPPINNSILTK